MIEYFWVILLNNKKIAVTVIIFVILFLAIACILGIAGHIPFLGKALSLVIAVILIAVVLGFFIIIIRRKK